MLIYMVLGISINATTLWNHQALLCHHRMLSRVLSPEHLVQVSGEGAPRNTKKKYAKERIVLQHLRYQRSRNQPSESIQTMKAKHQRGPQDVTGLPRGSGCRTDSRHFERMRFLFLIWRYGVISVDYFGNFLDFDICRQNKVLDIYHFFKDLNMWRNKTELQGEHLLHCGRYI